MAKSFTGTEFIKALAEGSLREPIVKEGIVKPADNDPNAIMFSEGTSCLFWTKIPVEMIEKVEYATTIRCQDHEHPFVRLFLKDPPAENKVATLLAELLRQTPQRQSPAIGANTLRPAAPTPGVRDEPVCHPTGMPECRPDNTIYQQFWCWIDGSPHAIWKPVGSCVYQPSSARPFPVPIVGGLPTIRPSAAESNWKFLGCYDVSLDADAGNHCNQYAQSLGYHTGFLGPNWIKECGQNNVWGKPCYGM